MSQLHIKANYDLTGKTVKCIHNNGVEELLVGMYKGMKHPKVVANDKNISLAPLSNNVSVS